MLRIADFAHEDGTGIYPAIDTVASDIGASRRQTQYAIKALESCNLITRVGTGGVGGRKTNIWEINVDMLVQLALKEFTLEGKHDCLEVVENEGAIIAPRDLLRVQSIASRVQSATDRGATGSTQTLNNHYLESPDASADARDSSRTSPAVEKYVPSLTVSIGDASWGDWISHLDSDIKPLAEARGRLEVSKRWPDAKAVLHTHFPKSSASSLTDLSKRIIGEGE